MMTCREVTTLANDFVERRLTRRQRFGVRLHLMMCKHCRRLMRQLEATIAVVRASRVEEAPAPAHEQAMLDLFRRARRDDDDPPR